MTFFAKMLKNTLLNMVFECNKVKRKENKRRAKRGEIGGRTRFFIEDSYVQWVNAQAASHLDIDDGIGGRLAGGDRRSSSCCRRGRRARRIDVHFLCLAVGRSLSHLLDLLRLAIDIKHALLHLDRRRLLLLRGLLSCLLSCLLRRLLSGLRLFPPGLGYQKVAEEAERIRRAAHADNKKGSLDEEREERQKTYRSAMMRFMPSRIDGVTESRISRCAGCDGR